jgi:uncharacterized coiled-coil protein SlyX
VAKLIKILAASVGGGIALGAGIRLGEAIAGRNPAGLPGENQNLLQKLDEMENRLVSLEKESPSSIVSRIEMHAAGVSAVGAELGAETRRIEALGETAVQLRGDLRGWLEESVAAKMAEVETRLRAESEHSRKEMLDALVEGVQTRVLQRISKLEDEVASQSAAMTELRECSLRTERSVHQLLGGIDKLIVKYPAAAPEKSLEKSPEKTVESLAEAAAPVKVPEPPAPAAPLPAAQPPAKGRWRIFG